MCYSASTGSPHRPCLCCRSATASPKPPELFSLFAGGVARVARRLAFGFERQLPGGGLFLFTRQLGCGLRRRLGLAAFLLGLGGLARQSGLATLGGMCLALGLPLLHCRIVETRLAAKLVEHVLPGLLGRLLPVRKARFLKSTHNGPCLFHCLL